MQSIWEKNAQLPTFEPLRREIRADALVIGGGLTGLLCAHELTQAGLRCVVAEAGHICGGVTKNTTAKLTVQHGLVFHKLLRRFGTERARAYLDANWAALNRIRALCQDIPCDFEEKPNYVYSLDDPRELERELAALDKLGRPAALAKDLPLPFPVAGAVRFDRQAQFHPLKFAATIAEKLPIFEHTRVLEVEPGRAVTEHGTIKAEHIVVATHFPFLNKFGAYWLKLYQSRSYVLALEGAPKLGGMYVDASGKGLSFRNYDNMLLLGGGGHRTGKPGTGWTGLEDFARRHYPGAHPSARWSAQDCMSLDGAPYIGLYSPRLPGLYAVTFHPPPPAGRQCRGKHAEPAHPHPAPVPPYGLRLEIQPPGAQLGLPLPRLPVCRRWAAAGRPRHERPDPCPGKAPQIAKTGLPTL